MATTISGVFEIFFKYPVQQILAEEKTNRQERQAFAQSHDDENNPGIGEVWLQGQNQNRPEILEDENSQGDSTGHGIQFKLVIQELDDNGGTAQGAEHRQIKGLDVALTQVVAQQHEESHAHQYREGKLADSGIEQLPSRRQQVGGIEFQADDEQQQDQADFGNDFDIGWIGYQPEANLGSDHRSGDQIPQNHRLTKPLKDKAKHRGCQDGNTDLRKNTVHESSLYPCVFRIWNAH